MAVDDEGLRQDIEDPIRQTLGLSTIGNVGLEHGEFVAAQTGYHILGPGRGANPFRRQSQQRITALMAKRVVDLLEPVEVDIVDGEAALSQLVKRETQRRRGVSRWCAGARRGRRRLRRPDRGTGALHPDARIRLPRNRSVKRSKGEHGCSQARSRRRRSPRNRRNRVAFAPQPVR